MSEKIEFEGEAVNAQITVTERNGQYISNRLVIDVSEGASCVVERGRRYRVTLEPVEPELEPCPFAERNTIGNNLGIIAVTQRDWFVKCRDCDARGPRKSTRLEAIRAWNQREASDALYEQAKREIKQGLLDDVFGE